MRSAAAVLALCVGVTPSCAAEAASKDLQVDNVRVAATAKVAANVKVAATVKTPPTGCTSFIRDFAASATGFHATFERPLTISRGFGDLVSGVEVHILASNTDVDGTLKCRGDEFLRFEARVTIPAKDKTLNDFMAVEQAALMAVFHWDRAKAQTIEKAMSQDAGEYLRASIQRGDLYDSGKVEYHQADQLDLGLIWTQADHTFVISSQTDD